MTMDRRTLTKALGAGVAAQVLGQGAEKLRATLITEAGGAHLGMYCEALAATDEIATVDLCDPSGESEAVARKTLGAKLAGVHRDHRAMLARVRPQFAAITLSGSSAPPVIDAALDAGCHILAEKPACVRYEDFAPLTAKANARGRHLVLALANRVDPVMLEARRLVQAGEIGKIYGVEIHIIADQTRLTRPEYHRSWTAQKARAGGGHLIWLGIHWLDLASWVGGSPIRSVAAFTANVGGQPLDVEDSATVTMRFTNGALGTLTSGYYLDKGYDSMLKLWGSKGWLLVQKHGGVALEWSSGGKVRQMGEAEKEPASVYVEFLRAVAKASVGMGPLPLTNAESLTALRAVFACYRSAENGRTETLGA
jgi:UDP-N-acetyl-2-amino-2-deoxyglucuronate dehydrogenase